MSRRDRSIATFGDVASTDTNKNEIVSDIDSDNNNTSVSIMDIIGDTEEKKQFIGIYFDADVAKALKKLMEQAKGKKGVQSKIVNEATRKFLEDNGLIGGHFNA